MDGIVLTLSCRLGQTVNPGAELVTLTDPKALEVQSTVVEQDLPLVRIGQSVQLFFDALPETNITGKVARMVPQRASDTQAIFPITITLDEIPDQLVPGMTVDAFIVIARQTAVLRLPKAIVHAHSDGTAQVQVWRDGMATTHTIKVGLRGDSFVEVLDGLALGDQVVAQ